MRCALRTVRTKRPLCARARLICRHLERMTAQETTLKASKSKSAVFATAPVCITKSTISPPTKKRKTGEACIGLGKTPAYDYRRRRLWRPATHPIGQRQIEQAAPPQDWRAAATKITSAQGFRQLSKVKNPWGCKLRSWNHRFGGVRVPAFLSRGVDRGH